MRIFSEDLAKEIKHSSDSRWGRIYSDLFPDMISYTREYNRELQKSGIDRVIKLSNGKLINVDEKVRYKEYNDIALEHWSSFEDKVLGWCLKPLDCDYILYVFWQSCRYYLIPFPELRRLFEENFDIWRKQYTVLKTRNRGTNSDYTTISICVPIDLLMAALPDMQHGCLQNE